MKELILRVRESNLLMRLLTATSLSVTVLSVLAFLYAGYAFLKESLLSLFRYLLILGISYAAVSVFRRILKAPRPFEVYGIKGVEKDGGCSHPSRHAFSAFAIASATCFVSVPMGAVLLFLGVLLCVARVLLGYHFVRDVVAGAVIGIISVLLGMIIISPF